MRKKRTDGQFYTGAEIKPRIIFSGTAKRDLYSDDGKHHGNDSEQEEREQSHLLAQIDFGVP